MKVENKLQTYIRNYYGAFLKDGAEIIVRNVRDEKELVEIVIEDIGFVIDSNELIRAVKNSIYIDD
jgi:hypothetical protein